MVAPGEIPRSPGVFLSTGTAMIPPSGFVTAQTRVCDRVESRKLKDQRKSFSTSNGARHSEFCELSDDEVKALLATRRGEREQSPTMAIREQIESDILHLLRELYIRTGEWGTA